MAMQGSPVHIRVNASWPVLLSAEFNQKDAKTIACGG